MKNIFGTLIVILSFFSAKSQCIYSLNKDTISVCETDEENNTPIFVAPELQYEPITVEWHCSYPDTSIPCDISKVIFTSTDNNPQLIYPVSTMMLYAEISDTIGNTCLDSILIKRYPDVCIACTGGDPPIYIAKGDTFDMNTDGAGFFFCFDIPLVGVQGEFTYKWYPPIYILNPDSLKAAFFPPVSTRYLITITNSNYPCSCISSLLINVNPLSVSNTEVVKTNIYPNPTSDYLMIETEENYPLNISICSIDGKELFRAAYVTNEKIPVHHLPAGIYLLRLSSTNGDVSFRKLLISR